jgi:hypothetical protein
MALVFIAAVLLAAAAATAAICRFHGMPLGWILRSTPLRYGTLLVGVPAAALGILVWVAVRDFAFASAGAALGSLLPLRYMHRARKDAGRFAQGAVDDDTAAAIVSELRDKQPAPGSTLLAYEIEVISTATQLVASNRLDAAEKILQLLEWKVIDGPARVTGATLLATCYLRSGLVPQAREALERGRGLVHEFGDRDRFELVDATILVHEGKLERVLARLEQIDAMARRLPALRMDFEIARIHAAAKRGDSDAALELIGALRRDFGAGAFAFLARPEGPASAMAAQLASRSAYR